MTVVPSIPEARERALRICLARMRRAPLDFQLRVEAAEHLIAIGERDRGVRVLRSCADYFTLAGFPVRALWALKLLEHNGAELAVVERGLNLLAKHYARRPREEWGEPIFEMPMRIGDSLDLDDLPATLEAVIAEVERRATDIIRGVNFPDRLPQFPLLSELAERPFVTVSRAIRLRHVDDGVALVREGEPGQSVHIVVTGRARVVKHGTDGRVSTLARLVEGDIFGEMALITESPRVASVVADGDLDVFELPRSVLDELGRDADTLQSVLSRHVSNRMINNLINLSPVFEGMPKSQRRGLMERFESRLFEADRKIVKEGEPSGGLYIILDGMVKVVRQHEGAERTLNLLREGELFGEISLIHNSAATATCIATRRTMVLFLSRREFEQVARDFPGVRERVNHLGEIRLLDSIYMLA